MPRSLCSFAMVAIWFALPNAPAQACHNVRNWPTGAELDKLHSDDLVVRAKLIESYKGEQNVPTIMGSPYGMMYLVQVMKVMGSGAGAKPDISDDGKAQIFVRMRPQTCEQYVPRDFGQGAEQVLVVRKGAAGAYDLVGGHE